MENREAIDILLKMIEKYQVEAKEKEAILTAVGILDWTALGKKRAIENAKKKKDRQTDID